MTVSHYVSEDRSDMRGIKQGWYAMADDGNFWAFFQSRGMHQDNHAADEPDGGAQATTRDDLPFIYRFHRHPALSAASAPLTQSCP